jgi:hypothetical protein
MRPGGQSWQTELLVAPTTGLNIPMPQPVQICAFVPENVPARHVLHPRLPVSSWYVPGAHGVHDGWPATAANVPAVQAGQEVGSEELENEPGAQARHVALLDAPMAVEYLPAEHCTHALLVFML